MNLPCHRLAQSSMLGPAVPGFPWGIKIDAMAAMEISVFICSNEKLFGFSHTECASLISDPDKGATVGLGGASSYGWLFPSVTIKCGLLK